MSDPVPARRLQGWGFQWIRRTPPLPQIQATEKPPPASELHPGSVDLVGDPFEPKRLMQVEGRAIDCGHYEENLADPLCNEEIESRAGQRSPGTAASPIGGDDDTGQEPARGRVVGFGIGWPILE